MGIFVGSLKCRVTGLLKATPSEDITTTVEKPLKEDRMKKTTFFAVIFVATTLSFFGCDRSVGANSEKGSLTRRQLVVDLVSMVKPEALDETVACTSMHEDVEDNSDLCRALDLLYKRGEGLRAFSDGQFKPEEYVPHAEMWVNTVQILGFASFPRPLCATDVSGEEWYSWSLGPLCAKGLYEWAPDGNSQPSEITSREEWETQKELLRSYLEQNTTRLDLIEHIQAIIYMDTFTINSCTSSYEDVEENSLACYLTEAMLNEGLLDHSQANFRINETLVWDEAVKFSLMASGIDPVDQCTGCMSSPEHWGCNWMDKLCEIELDFGFIVSGENITRYGLTRFMWALATYNNSTL